MKDRNPTPKNQAPTDAAFRVAVTPSGVMSRESWKIFQIMAEFVAGFERLSQIQPSVSIFGSSRVQPGHPYYALTVEIARKLSDAGFAVVSGGGPGLMEAANKGALDAGGNLWDFFGDLSNESIEIDAFMGKLFDSLPVWLSPAESTFTGFLNEKDVVKLRGLLDALGEGRRERSSYLREFYAYLKRAEASNLGLTAAAVPVGTRWQDEAPRRIAEHW